MRVLVCGDRGWTDEDMIRLILLALPLDSVVITGGASGADYFANKVAVEIGLECPVYEADWASLGKAAGPERNAEMLKAKPDIVFAFHDYIRRSKGTADMIRQADRAGIPVMLFSHPRERHANA